MSVAARLFLSFATLPIFSASLPGQLPATALLEKHQVLVNVWDAHGKPIRDLRVENFRLWLNGKPGVVFGAGYSIAPHRIVVLLDISGSMTESMSGKWQIVREVVNNFLTQTPGEVPVATVAFTREVESIFDFSQSRAAIPKWMNENAGYKPNPKRPNTALFDAVLAGLKVLSPVQPGDMIYAITDGGENASHASAAQTREALLKSGVRLYAFLFAEPPPFDNNAMDSFLDMVDDSGGYAFGVTGHRRPFTPSWGSDFLNDKDMQERVRAFNNELNVQASGFWTLQTTVPASAKDTKVKLEIVTPDGKARKDVGLTYPRLLAPYTQTN
jgi:von Willebrand factor type A domain